MTSTTLLLRPRALLSGGFYLFRLACEGSVVDVEVTTNANPVGGSLMIAPSSGWVLETLFSLAAPLWRDPDGDYPLKYIFSFFELSRTATIGTWITIPSDSSQAYIQSVYLPTGMMNRSYELPMRCTIVDSLDGESWGSSISSVRPIKANSTLFSSGTNSQEILQRLLQSVNQTIVHSTSMQVQQLTTVIASVMRQNTLFGQSSGGILSKLTLSQQLTLANTLLFAVNSSLVTTDLQNMGAARMLRTNVTQLVSDIKIAISKQQASSALTSLLSNTTIGRNQSALASASALAGQTSSLLDSLAASILSNSVSPGMQVLQISTETVKLSVALVPLSPSNDSSVSYLPPVSIPDSKSTINIAQDSSASGSALISVASFDASLVQAALASKQAASANTSSSAKGGLPEPELISDVISVKVSYTGDSGSAELPVFAANMEVDDNTNYVSAIFTHNCTIGVQESISFLCTESSVRMNLTCSGKAKAVVRRSCPVPHRVCNVLSMTDFSVASDSYCRAIQSVGSMVTCECGLDSTEHGKNSTNELTSLLGTGSAINVAVMTEFVTGDFGGTVIAGSTSLTGNIAEQSKIVFLSFGLLWGFGIASMVIHYFAIDLSSLNIVKAKKNTNPKITPVAKQINQIVPVEKSLGKSMQRSYGTMKKYLVAVLPSVYQPVPWLRRLSYQLFHHHKYISIFSFLWTIINPNEGNKQGDTTKEESAGLTNEQKRKKSVLEVAYMLTAITVSCFTLAVLYDIQYPADDGTCAPFQEENSCLTRKTLLDPGRSYCKWSVTGFESPGSITEFRENQIIQTIPLESVAMDTDVSRCVFDDSDPSGYVMLTALIITTMVTLPLDVGLKVVFKLLQAKSNKEQKVRSFIKQSVLLKRTFVDGEGSKSNGQVRKADGRRGGIFVANNQISPTKDTVTRVANLANPSPPKAAEALQASPTDGEVMLPPSRLQQWCQMFSVVKLNIKCPSVTHSISLARMASLDAWMVLHDHRSYRYNPRAMSKIHHKFKHMVQSLHPTSDGVKTIIRRPPDSKDEQIRLETLKLQLQHATFEESGTLILQSLFRDILNQETAIGKRFAKVLQKDFPVEFYVSEALQWILSGVIIVLNLGALYYVILKGTSRGQGWQRSLLQVCFLDWFIEVLVHQSFQVYFVHFVLPNLIYEDVQASLAALLRSCTALIHDIIKFRGAIPIGELTLRSSLAEIAYSDSLAGSPNAAIWVTQQAVLAAAIEKRILMESQLALYCNARHFFSEEQTPRQVFTVAPNTNVFVRKVMYFLFFVSGFPVSLQRITAGVISSAMFSAMSTLWIAIKHIEGGGGIMAAFVLFLSMMIAVGLLYWHRRTLFYYLNAGYLPRKIALIAPSMHGNLDTEVDDADEHEEKENTSMSWDEGSEPSSASFLSVRSSDPLHSNSSSSSSSSSGVSASYLRRNYYYQHFHQGDDVYDGQTPLGPSWHASLNQLHRSYDSSDRDSERNDSEEDAVDDEGNIWDDEEEEIDEEEDIDEEVQEAEDFAAWYVNMVQNNWQEPPPEEESDDWNDIFDENSGADEEAEQEEEYDDEDVEIEPVDDNGSDYSFSHRISIADDEQESFVESTNEEFVDDAGMGEHSDVTLLLSDSETVESQQPNDEDVLQSEHSHEHDHEDNQDQTMLSLHEFQIVADGHHSSEQDNESVWNSSHTGESEREERDDGDNDPDDGQYEEHHMMTMQSASLDQSRGELISDNDSMVEEEALDAKDYYYGDCSHSEDNWSQRSHEDTYGRGAKVGSELFQEIEDGGEHSLGSMPMVPAYPPLSSSSHNDEGQENNSEFSSSFSSSFDTDSDGASIDIPIH
jgi:hypothetical protein